MNYFKTIFIMSVLVSVLTSFVVTFILVFVVLPTVSMTPPTDKIVQNKIFETVDVLRDISPDSTEFDNDQSVDVQPEPSQEVLNKIKAIELEYAILDEELVSLFSKYASYPDEKLVPESLNLEIESIQNKMDILADSI